MIPTVPNPVQLDWAGQAKRSSKHFTPWLGLSACRSEIELIVCVDGPEW